VIEYPRPLSLVKIKPSWKAAAESYQFPFLNDMPLVYFGEIPNMREHGIFVGYSSGRIYSGFHIDYFIELSEDEI